MCLIPWVWALATIFVSVLITVNFPMIGYLNLHKADYVEVRELLSTGKKKLALQRSQRPLTVLLMLTPTF